MSEGLAAQGAADKLLNVSRFFIAPTTCEPELDA
jgi:hypothetical protein